jgi:steroid 5-alpha reductase family enzyme
MVLLPRGPERGAAAGGRRPRPSSAPRLGAEPSRSNPIDGSLPACMTTPSLPSLLLANLALLAACATLVWLVSLRLRDASIVDLFWGMAFVLVAWNTRRLLGAASAPASLALPVAATLWGVRLTAYLGSRNLGHGEDRRYAAMRGQRPRTFWWWSYFAVFLLQAGLALVVALPLVVGQRAPRPAELTAWDLLGGTLFLGGLAFETLADLQLARFKRDPKSEGQVMDRGLWRWSRHPNYFGEAVLWWGVWLMASAAPDARWTALAPALMTFLLLRVSGVALLESTIAERRPGYRDYVQRTRAFVPGPRRP